jgi:hypothetical protein
LWLNQMANVFGMGGKNLPEGELANQLAKEIQISVATGKGQGTVSNFERELFGQASVNMGTSLPGLRAATQFAKQINQLDHIASEVYRDNAKRNGGVPNMIEADEEIARRTAEMRADIATGLRQYTGGGNTAAPGAASSPPGAGFRILNVR